VVVVVVVASTVVVVLAVAGSTAVALEAESAAAEVESALVEHTSQVVLGTLPAEDRASLHLVILHLASLSMRDESVNRQHAMLLRNDRR
jgi:hypothetical protein